MDSRNQHRHCFHCWTLLARPKQRNNQSQSTTHNNDDLEKATETIMARLYLPYARNSRKLTPGACNGWGAPGSSTRGEISKSMEGKGY